MKRFLTVALAAAIGLTMAGVASAATDVTNTTASGDIGTYNAGDAAGGIAQSRHNLGAFSIHAGANGTTGICVFCHTPHHTNKGGTNPAGLAPLWNKGTGSVTYTAYGTTIAGTTVLDSDIGSVSLACLTCHDGVSTFDNLVNAPGKGGVNASGAVQGWTFFEVGEPGILSPTMSDNPMMYARTNIGTDLSNDHPMSVVYNGGSAASLRDTSTTISAIDLTTGLAASYATFDGGNLTKNLWAVSGFVSNTATIADLLRGPSANRVECSSCHDPHFNNKSYNEVDLTYGTDTLDGEDESNGLFLRRVGGNTGSGVCRTCHAK
ncbi:MAG: hypothetical protein ACE5GY_03575 [Thermodesulfobacteriota bacterium]